MQIKRVDLNSKECSTVIGSGKSGDRLDGDVTSQNVLNEPGGLCFHRDGKRLFIADTNNHAIKVLDVVNKTMSKVK